MGRASLGASAKVKTGGVRVTQAEYDWFEQVHGGLGAFLKAKVAEELSRKDAEDDQRATMTLQCSGDSHVMPHRGCILR